MGCSSLSRHLHVRNLARGVPERSTWVAGAVLRSMWQGVAGGGKGWQGVARGGKGWQGVASRKRERTRSRPAPERGRLVCEGTVARASINPAQRPRRAGVLVCYLFTCGCSDGDRLRG